MINLTFLHIFINHDEGKLSACQGLQITMRKHPASFNLNGHLAAANKQVTGTALVFILEIGALVRSNLGHWICLRHFDKLRAVTNCIFFSPKRHIFFMRKLF